MKHPYAASRLPRSSVLGAACTLLAVACSSGTEEREPTPEGFPETGQIRLQLTRTNDCADLLGKIQDNVIAQLGERAKQLRVAPDYGFGPGIGMGTGGVTPDGNLGSDPRPGPPSSPNPGVPVDDGAPVNNGDADAPSGGNVDPSNDGAETPPTAPQSPAEGEGGGFSNTTVQVKDVDEADIVKTDGDLLYLLHGATLFVLNAWPAASTEIIGDALIEGDPIEMFVRDGKAIVFSRVYRDLALEASTEPVTPDYYRNYYSTNYTKLTVFDVTGATPSVTRESTSRVITFRRAGMTVSYARSCKTASRCRRSAARASNTTIPLGSVIRRSISTSRWMRGWRARRAAFKIRTSAIGCRASLPR